MTRYGVEQGCIRSQNIVCLLEVLEEDFIKEFTTADQFRKAIANKMDVLRSERNAHKGDK